MIARDPESRCGPKKNRARNGAERATASAVHVLSGSLNERQDRGPERLWKVVPGDRNLGKLVQMAEWEAE